MQREIRNKLCAGKRMPQEYSKKHEIICLKGYNDLECICVHEGLWLSSKRRTPTWSYKPLQDLVSVNLFNLISCYSLYFSLFSNISRATVAFLLPQDLWTSHHLLGEHGYLTLFSWMVPCHSLYFSIYIYITLPWGLPS